MWQQPKTNWKETDCFNIEDYNRIKGNLNEIRSQVLILWPDFTFEEMGSDKTYQDYGFHADGINRFESNVDHICSGTFPFQVGNRQTFYDNQPFIDWKELNRIRTNYIRNTVIIGFMANELISIVENAGLMGLPLQVILVKAIDVLKKKSEVTE